MELKDWILLLVPIFCNGVVVFALQKIYERKQAKRLIQNEYYSGLRARIDLALELHAKATRLTNEGNIGNDELIYSVIQKFIDSCLDVYYYYVQNKIIFISVERDVEKIAVLIMQLSEAQRQHDLSTTKMSNVLNELRDILQLMKKKSMR